MRRGTAMISAMVMSAVSSVSTPGVLVTVMPRAGGVVDVDIVDAVAEIGDQLQLLAGLRSMRLVDPVGDGRHQHVGEPVPEGLGLGEEAYPGEAVDSYGLLAKKPFRRGLPCRIPSAARAGGASG
jgi:hypothetical protein